MAITAVFFDFIGTTVLEKNNDVVISCFQKAFDDFDIKVEKEVLKQHRGKDKQEMISEVIRASGKNAKQQRDILGSFKKHFLNSLDQFYEPKDLDSTIAHIKSKKAKIGVGTGLTRDILQILLEHFRWERFGFDYINTAEDIGKGRPDPMMIIDMMVKLHLNNFQFLKVGDTAADIQEGKNASVMTAAILTGTQSENTLRKEQPDYIIKSLSELKTIV